MSKSRTIYIKNGDMDVPYVIYSCERCGKDVEEAHPNVKDEDRVYCWDCAFINGLLSESEYLSHCGIALPKARAAHRDGEIYIEPYGGKFPWEKKKKDYRNDPRYTKWRTAVFERDNYTCQKCGKVGGELNAHHIKPFAKYEKLRYEVDNGITLCVKCHRKVHKDGNL